MNHREVMERVESHRAARKMSVASICAAAGVNPVSYRTWISGRHSPTMANLIAVADVIGLTISVGVPSDATAALDRLRKDIPVVLEWVNEQT